MLFEIDPREGRPIYRQIMDEVRRGIVAGLLEANMPLPAVRELAAELHVNPNTVQQAYRQLEQEGLLHVRRGLGTFVSQDAPSRAKPERVARRVAERALRDAYRHGLLASDLIAAIDDIAPRRR